MTKPIDDKITAFAREIAKHKIDSCYAYQNDRLVFQHVRHSAASRNRHKVNSVTKSVISLLIGIAIDHGEIASVAEPVRTWLPDAPADVTVRHLLTMSPGWDWPEWGAWGGRPFPMMNSKDWVRFIWSMDRTETPGTRWRYDSGSSQLLSVILQQATGRTAEEYAASRLFGPLGIENFRWYTNAKGHSIGGFGLELLASDMPHIGLLMLEKGMRQGRRIVSEIWAEQSTAVQIGTGSEVGDYGYHWWVLREKPDVSECSSFFFAMGYGGQYIFVVPDDRLVVTFASSLYKDTFLPLRLFRQLIKQAPGR